MKTKHEIVIENWRGHGKGVVPAGQPVKPADHGDCFVESFGNIFNPRKDGICYHDATYYSIRVAATECE